MCDTLVAMPASTKARRTLFAKNSDRERNEAQYVCMTPAVRHAPGQNVRLTYLTIPQSDLTHACLLSRPFWMWGAEMGANEHGVVIGNEAVHSIEPAPRRRALTGMDLVRLGLERATTAQSAAETIIQLLERYGQGGDCGHLNRFYYHNSFIIADAVNAYVLETVGRWWAIERVAETRALSNALSIGDRYDQVSLPLKDHAKTQGWLDSSDRFDFSDRLIDRKRDTATQGESRCARGTSLLNHRRGRLTVTDMMGFLRDHGADGSAWSPQGSPGRTLCMHATTGARRSQTVGSMVSEIGEAPSIHWLTASAAPCLSLFKPVLFESGLPNQGTRPTDRFDATARWWRHEELHRHALRDFPEVIQFISERRDSLEREFVERIDTAISRGGDPSELRIAVEACWRSADLEEQKWCIQTERIVGGRRAWDAYAKSWARLNQLAGMTTF